MDKNNYSTVVSIIVAIIVVVGIIAYAVGYKSSSNQNQNIATSTISVSQPWPTDVILGSSTAPVTLIEYGDYQCPYCAMFNTQIEPALKIAYVQTGKLKIIFRDIAFVGAESEAAGQAALCAADQDKFWPYHDLLYQSKLNDFNNKGSENDGFYNRNLFINLARQLNLNITAFENCYDSGKYAKAVKNDTNLAIQQGINSTPSIFINGQEMPPGLLPLSDYQKAIESALASSK